ncbi:MAG: hypothetical protein ACREBR_03950 [bacterium]
MLAEHQQHDRTSIVRSVKVAKIHHVYDSPSGGASTYHEKMIASPPTDKEGIQPKITEQFQTDFTNMIQHLIISDQHRRLTAIDPNLQSLVSRVITRIPPLNNESWRAQGMITNLPPALFGARRQATELLRRMLYNEYTLSSPDKFQSDPLLNWHNFCRSIGKEFHANKLQDTHGVYTLYTSTHGIANRLFYVLGSEICSTTRTLSLFGSPARIVRVRNPLQRDKLSTNIIQLLSQATNFYTNECITITSACIQDSNQAIQTFPQIPGFRGFGIVPATKRTPSQIQLFLKKHSEQPVPSSINSNSMDEIKCLLPPDISNIILKPPQPRYTKEPSDSLEMLIRTIEDIEEFKGEVANFFNAPNIYAPPSINNQTTTLPTNNSTNAVSTLSEATQNSKPPDATASPNTSNTTPLREPSDDKLGHHLRPRGGIGRGLLGQRGGRLHHDRGGRGGQGRGWRSSHSGTNDREPDKTTAETLKAETTSPTMKVKIAAPDLGNGAAETPANGSKSNREQTATNQLIPLG